MSEQWRPWATRPRDGRMVVAWHHATGHAETVWSHADGWSWFDGESSLDDPRYWMPHPEPPEDGT